MNLNMIKIDAYVGTDEYEGFTKNEIVMDKIGSAMLNIVVWSVGLSAIYFFAQQMISAFS